MNERKITSEEIFGQVEDDTPADKFEARGLRKKTSLNFMWEVDELIRNFPDTYSRKGRKLSQPLTVKVDNNYYQIRAVKETSPWEQEQVDEDVKKLVIHYINVDYRLVVSDLQGTEKILFNFQDILFPDRDNSKKFSHGDTKVTNEHGKMATNHEALQALWSVRLLGEQLAARQEFSGK